MTLFSDLGFLILFAAVGGVLAIRFKQPAVLGLLAIGALVGPNYLGLVRESEIVNIVADIGAILLLFTIGIEFNLNKLSKLGMRVVLIALFKLGIVFLLSFWLGSLLGFTPLMSLYLGVILAITSTALVVRVLQQKDLISKKEVPILVASLIVEDIFAIFALTVFSGLKAGAQLTSINLVISIFSALAILSIVYIITLKGLRSIFDWLVKYQASETMVLTALSLGVGLSYLAESVNLSPSIGAFLAGSMVASLPRGEELEKAISPFALVFSALFFMSMGMLIDLNSLGSYWEIIIIIAVANLLFKYIGMASSTYLFGFSSKSAVFSGLAMLSVGEFSLLIAKESTGAINGTLDLVGITSVVVFVSSLYTSFLVGRYESIHGFTLKIIPDALKTRGRRFAHLMRDITFAFEPGGRFFSALGRYTGIILNNLATIGLFLGVIAAGWFLLSTYTVKVFGYEVSVFSLLAIGVSAIIAYISYRMLKYFLLEYNLVRRSLITQHKKEFEAATLAGDFVKLLMVLVLFISSPFLLSIFEIPPYFSRIIVIFVFLVLVWRFLDLIGFEKEKPKQNQVFFKNN